MATPAMAKLATFDVSVFITFPLSQYISFLYTLFYLTTTVQILLHCWGHQPIHQSTAHTHTHSLAPFSLEKETSVLLETADTSRRTAILSPAAPLYLSLPPPPIPSLLDRLRSSGTFEKKRPRKNAIHIIQGTILLVIVFAITTITVLIPPPSLVVLSLYFSSYSSRL